jgi:group II intron reverse transcriptase/maturase
VDIDIEGFFDNVNHSKLLKQIWTMGIRDKQLLAIIGKMLKAPIKMPDKTIVYPTKGTPQGGILSPLLSNIVLNELDWWVSSNWENMPTRYNYWTATFENGTVSRGGAHEALKKTNVKEMWMVRYADDFKIFCRNYDTANRTFHAVQGWLKDRLKLNISAEKSKIVNLRKNYSEFLGFKLKVRKKRKKYVVTSSMSDKAVKKATNKLIDQIKRIQRPKDEKDKFRMILNYNTKVMGIHNYYKFVTHVNLDCRKIAFQVMIVLKNRLRKALKSPKDFLKKKQKVPDSGKYISRRYGKSKQLRFVSIYPIAPIGYVQNQYPRCKKRVINKYTAEGRAEIHCNLGIDTSILLQLMRNPVSDRSIQYADNRISLYAAQYGKCAVTGILLDYDDIHCHHKTPRHKGGDDAYKNLVIVHKDIHRLIHATDNKVISRYLSDYKGQLDLQKLNKLRKQAGTQIISLDNSTAS